MRNDSEIFWTNEPYTMDVYTYVRIYTIQLGFYIGILTESFKY